MPVRYAPAVTGRLVVLGSCGAWPEAGRACSGYVLEHDGFRVVLDLGYGTLPRLLSHLGNSSGDGVDALVVTHHHPDHVVDAHGLFRARRFSRRSARAIPLYGTAGVLEKLVSLEDGDAAAIESVFDFRVLPADPEPLGPFLLESVPLPHFVPNAGVRLSSPEVTVAYSGDTGPDPALEVLGRRADLFILEATDREQRPDVPQAPPGRRLQLSGREAGEAAAAAGATRLLLSHFWPENDRELTRASAAGVFTGEVLVATEGLEIDLA